MAVPLIVQAKSATGTTSPLAATLATGTTAGNCLVAAIGEGNSTTNPTVSGITLGGSAGNWALAVANKVNADANAELWTDQNCAGGQTAVSTAFNAGTGTGNGYMEWVYEVANVVATSAVDKTNSGGAASGAWSSGSTGTLTQPNEIAIGVGVGIGSGGAPTITGPSAPWSNQASVTAARTSMISGSQVVSATTALTYSGTVSTGRVGAAILTLLGTAGTAVALTPFQVTIAAPAPTPKVVVPLPPFRVTIAAPVPIPSGVVQLQPFRVNLAAYPLAQARTLLVSLASRNGTDDYGNSIIQGIFAAAGKFEGPPSFFYDPSPGFGNLTASISGDSGVDEFGNDVIAGVTSYVDNGTFWSATVLFGGTVNWYKASGPGGPWTTQAGIGFTFNTLTGGGLNFSAPAGFSGLVGAAPIQWPVPTPAATVPAVIAALQQLGAFQ